MLYKKIPAILLFLFSFAVITVGGYQCATEVGQKQIPITYGDGPSPTDPTDQRQTGPSHDRYNPLDRRGSLPDKPPDRCARKQYRDLADSLGEMGVLKFNTSRLRDYSLGRAVNFDFKCPRLYLNMSGMSGNKNYEGELSISYETTGSITVDQFQSGSSAEENKHNRWVGKSWRKDRKGNVDKKFYAIFENTDRAIILKIEDVRVRDLRDGKKDYYGAGELYYKMFRYSPTAGKNDPCYKKGTYMKHARQQPSRENKCWLNSTGPFNCLPNGGVPVRGGRVPAVPSIDITGSLPCYSKLGHFFNINIRKAFDVGDVDELD